MQSLQRTVPSGRGAQVFCEDVELIARAHVAAAGELLPALEHLHHVVAPADVGAALRGGLRAPDAADGEGVVGDAAEVLAAVAGYDEGVELAVVLEDAAAVDAYYMALAVD